MKKGSVHELHGSLPVYTPVAVNFERTCVGSSLRQRFRQEPGCLDSHLGLTVHTVHGLCGTCAIVDGVCVSAT